MKASPAWHDEARSLHASGMRQKEIAEALGKRPGTVWKALHPDEIRAATARYKDENRETIRSKGREYMRRVRKEDPERERRNDLAFAADHPGYMTQKMREYRATHPDYVQRQNAKRRAYMASYAKEHPETMERFRERHPGYFTAYASKRRVIEETTGAPADAKAVEEMYRRAKEAPRVVCPLCRQVIAFGKRTVDHVVPLSRGGAHRSSNLQILCKSCNSRKHAKLPQEVGMLL